MSSGQGRSWAEQGAQQPGRSSPGLALCPGYTAVLGAHEHQLAHGARAGFHSTFSRGYKDRRTTWLMRPTVFPAASSSCHLTSTRGHRGLVDTIPVYTCVWGQTHSPPLEIAPPGVELLTAQRFPQGPQHCLPAPCVHGSGGSVSSLVPVTGSPFHFSSGGDPAEPCCGSSFGFPDDQ